ncbi:MAG TPA: ABC transporter ATP-binding protein [Puia sp.]|jgi:iron complex transport system ATP-binding protein|nr:ABC transporter ATP-binding protein [Puia sp.]
MPDPTRLLQTRDLQTGYRSGSKKTITTKGPLALEVRAGQLICLLGPNGAGKSTLLRTLAGLHPPLEGRVESKGVDVRQLTPTQRARTVSLVLTERVGTHQLTVYSLVALGRYPYSGWMGGLGETDRNAIEWAIEAAGIQTLRDRKLFTLSDGESQKVMLARALAQDTPVLMLDEPTAHLDLPSRIRLMRLLHQLAHQTNKGILLSTHELELALQVADEVWLLQNTATFHRGAPEDLVLNGAFEEAFAHEDIHFDKLTGTFSIQHDNRKPVLFTGEGLPSWWTRRALQRNGFFVVGSVAAGAEPTPRISLIEKEGQPYWRLESAPGDIQEFDSIAALLAGLEQRLH